MDIAKIATELEHTGYIVLARPLVDKLLAELFTRCHDDDPMRFHAAQVGRGAAKQQIGSIRGDVIDWMDAGNSTDLAYLACMEELRLGLNAALFLGLFDFESHYAIYGSGDGYAKHSDVLQGKKNRILSTVLYLNEDWHACDGGELVVFEATGKSIVATVNPIFGTMIIFLSESFPHEVLTSHATRRSIAGWFRVSGS
ncbi:2OG-Fe(II) oxygenase superfamily protein [mine drainage metagenome]|uniref:2OG-Fe(II) oxygenase superfamily protein n=1 Tax=mine drainage metagenome TaxID=410659 RepID=A0A1J5S5M8_9ZZZZ